MEKPAQFMQEIVCPSCAQQGHATWGSSDKSGGLRHMATLSENFEMRPGESGHDPLIVCRGCGATQRDQPAIGA